MNKFTKTMSMVAIMLGFGASASGQEPQTAQNEVAQKEGFMKRAFRDMKESARLQRQIDKANFKAQKLESKAFFEEQKRLSKPSVRSAAEKERMQKELEAANKRVEAAQAKVEAVRK